MATKDIDRYEWMRDTAQHLRSGELAALDPVAMADWFDEVSNSDRREVNSRLARLIEHRLKLDYVTGPELERNERGWDLTVSEQVRELASIFDESPSLRNHLTPKLLHDTYSRVAPVIARVYKVSLPDLCPYTTEIVNAA